VKVTLTWSEVMQAAMVGVMRQTTNLRDGRKDAHGLGSELDGWGLHVEGCCGEMAAAKALGVFWSGSHGTLRVPDIGEQFQVRTRTLRTQQSNSLILHPSDLDDAIFILVLGRVPAYEVAGWIQGAAGKRPEHWKDPAGGRPAFFVPPSVLRPIQELKGSEVAL
jgi:hypothetical protein